MLKNTVREGYASVAHGLRRDLPPMKLFEKAKQFGVWNPSTIDITQDKLDWQQMTPEQREVMLHLTTNFQAGEEAVTLDLLPLIMTIANEGRIEEEMFLTTFLWEEAKHVDFFGRYMAEVMVDHGDLTRFETPTYRLLFNDVLPSALQALLTDPSPAAQVRASVTYNMIVEGVLAETGYQGFFTVMDREGIMPGAREGITLLKQDESRHIAYGIYLLSRLISEDGSLWQVAEDTMNELLPLTLEVINSVFEPYDPMPFGLDLNEFVGYALSQFNKRLARVEKAQTSSLDEIYRITSKIIDENDG